MINTISYMTSLGQELQDISILLAQRQNRGHDTFNKSASLFTLGAETTFTPPSDAATQRAFSRVIGGFNAFNTNKNPQGWLQFKDMSTGSACGSLIEQVPISSNF